MTKQAYARHPFVLLHRNLFARHLLCQGFIWNTITGDVKGGQPGMDKQWAVPGFMSV